MISVYLRFRNWLCHLDTRQALTRRKGDPHRSGRSMPAGARACTKIFRVASWTVVSLQRTAGSKFETTRMCDCQNRSLVRGIILATARIYTPDSDSLKNKRHSRMKYRVTNHDRDGYSTIHCLMCNAQIVGSPGRPLDLICLICRAAILDRIFQAQRRRLQPWNAPNKR